ncbi:hypothetical protein PIB30_058426, partial [Stylosanthes scabra]|nr:hypothetical protein [Stylosanthes scabra]
ARVETAIEGWMCEGDNIETKGVHEEVVERNEGANGINEGDSREKEVEEEEEDPEDDPSEMLVASRARDMDAYEDYLQYLEELRHHPKYSLTIAVRHFAQDLSDDLQSPPSDARSQPSFELSGIWPSPVGPSQ